MQISTSDDKPSGYTQCDIPAEKSSRSLAVKEHISFCLLSDTYMPPWLMVAKAVCLSDYLFLQDLLQLRNNGVTHFLGASTTTKVLGHNAAVDGILDCLLNNIRLLRQTKGVPQHHCNREDCADRVDDTLP